MLGDYLFDRIMVLYQLIAFFSAFWIPAGAAAIGLLFMARSDVLSDKLFKLLMSLNVVLLVFSVLYLLIIPKKELAVQILKSWIY